MKLHLSLGRRALQIVRAPSFISTRSGFGVRHVFNLAFAIGVLVATSAPLQAKEKKDLEIILTAQRVMTDEAGVERFADAADAAPGDIVQYTAVFLNSGDKPLRHLTPTLPIPDGMEYRAASAIPAMAEASLDGRKFAAVPLIVERKLERGVEIFVEFPPHAYRALRWKITALAPGESITVGARAVVVAAQ